MTHLYHNMEPVCQTPGQHEPPMPSSLIKTERSVLLCARGSWTECIHPLHDLTYGGECVVFCICFWCCLTDRKRFSNNSIEYAYPTNSCWLTQLGMSCHPWHALSITVYTLSLLSSSSSYVPFFSTSQLKSRHWMPTRECYQIYVVSQVLLKSTGCWFLFTNI